MLLTLKEAKMHLGYEADYVDEKVDSDVQLLIDNAEIYIDDSFRPIKEMGPNSLKKAKLLAKMLISDWYDNSEYTSNISEKVRFSVRSLGMQLRFRGDD
ncbi:head-tail connector protein [Clostridium sp. YIM B02551]|uniref:head-tail connector protein n=1 Tax=Clostridium sp. YIM B02551 TaxID=2910679 RepID=UPI001EEA8CD6|nr:head-tail connector protein [Clostridium sp. YIM B02551]